MGGSRPAAMVAGILGGSGSHVVQIIIGVVVAVALISYFLVRVGGRGGGNVRAVAAAVSPRDRADSDGASEPAVRLVRPWSGIGIGAQSKQWDIAIDGTVVGSIANRGDGRGGCRSRAPHPASWVRQTPQRGTFIRCCGG